MPQQNPNTHYPQADGQRSLDSATLDTMRKISPNLRSNDGPNTQTDHHPLYCAILIAALYDMNHHTHHRHHRQDKMRSGGGDMYGELQPVDQRRHMDNAAANTQYG